LAVLDKETIHLYLQNGIGQLILDTSLLAVGAQVMSVGPDTVSVKLLRIPLGDEDLLGERIQISTRVENPDAKQVYGIDLRSVAADDVFIFFLRQEAHGFTLARVSGLQSILKGCFRVESVEHLDTFLAAMELLDLYLLPAGSVLADDFAEAPSLPACLGCLFLLRHDDLDVGGLTRYRCGRIWTPASLRGWLTGEALQAYGNDYGDRPPLCWTSPPK
jgi:hypothetical protein